MKGIILAGGKGSRLYPMTRAVSKPLIPIYDKPMVYYPLSVLLMAGIRDIMLITAPADCESYRRLLGDGSQFGIHVEYGVQPVARGIADAFLIAEEFIGGAPCCLVLGDNMFHGAQLEQLLRAAAARTEGATVFGYPVKNPSAYGVVEFDAQGQVLSIEEKPEKPKSRYAVPGLYFYDGDAAKLAHTLAAVRPRRAGDHGPQRAVSAAGEAPCGADDARHGMARHGDAGGHAQRRAVCGGRAVPAGTLYCLSRGDCLGAGIHFR